LGKPVDRNPAGDEEPVREVTGLGFSLFERRHGPRVLVVDDDPQIRDLLAGLLARLCRSISHARSAEEALEMLRAAPPDLLLLDVGLPGRNGFDVLTEIRASADLRLVPVVILSGTATREDKLRALRAGAADFFAKPFDSEELMTRLQSLLQLKSFTDTLEEAEKVIVALARTIDARDPYTAGHSERVSIYAAALGRQIGLPEPELTALRQGCLFHDLGKIAIRDEVLLKPGPLTPAEYEEMKRHAVLGRDLLLPMKTLARSLPVVYHHHERCDGSGYPDGLAGESIPLIARAAAIADVFDGMTSDRPYRDGLMGRDALDELEKEARAGLWDRALVDEFRGVMETLPRKGRRPEAA
jgi:putative two-component system response regulator